MTMIVIVNGSIVVCAVIIVYSRIIDVVLIEVATSLGVACNRFAAAANAHSGRI